MVKLVRHRDGGAGDQPGHADATAATATPPSAPVERLLARRPADQIFEGTTEIQRRIIADRLLRRPLDVPADR